MARSVYSPVIIKRGESQVLDLESTFKLPLTPLLEYINGIKNNNSIPIEVLNSDLFSKLEDRDKLELTDMMLDSNFYFTDDVQAKTKSELNKDDLKDIYFELVRRRYLDIKYDTEYILNTLIGKYYEIGTDIYFGTSILAVDVVTYYKLYLGLGKYKKSFLYSIKMGCNDYLDQYNIYYKVPFEVDKKDCVSTMMKTLLNPSNKINLNIRDRIRDLKYHKTKIIIENPRFSPELSKLFGMTKDNYGLKEGSDESRNIFNRLATSLYKEVLSKGYLIDYKYDSHGVFGALISETIWEILLSYMSKDPVSTINNNFKEGDMVLFSSIPAFKTMTKVLNVPDQVTYNYKDIFESEDKSGKPMLDENAVTIGRVEKINNSTNTISINQSIIIKKDRKFAQVIKRNFSDYFTPNTLKKLAIENKKIQSREVKKESYTNILPKSVTTNVYILIPCFLVDEMQHYPTKSFNLIINDDEFINSFNPIPWTVGERDKYIENMGYYHREILRNAKFE